MTDFWEHQDRARSRSLILLALFIVSVVITVAAINVAVATVVRWELRTPGDWRWLWDPRTCAITSGATVFIILAGTFLKFRELNIGGAAIADMIGGEPLSMQNQTADEVRLRHVVEEMAIAAGLPAPQIYIVKFEFCINAFVAGYTPGDAVIGVTEGAISKLTRDELQALVGHEFSHLFNGDMRLNMRLTGFVHGLMAVSVVGRALVLSSFRVRGLAPAGGKLFAPLWLLLGLVFWIIGYLGNLCGRAIQAALCRQREYLADASAVQYTRNPDAIAGVLKKAGWYNTWLRNPYASVANHFLFGDCFGDDWLRFFRTHPRIRARIRRIEPDFHGDFRRSLDELKFPEPSAPDLDDGRKMPAAAAPEPALPGLSQITLAAVPLSATLGALGALRPEQLVQAHHARAALPASLDEAVHEPLPALALTYAMLIGEEAELRKKQFKILDDFEAKVVAAEARRLLPLLKDHDSEERLTLAELAQPALRQLSRGQYRNFRKCLEKMVAADDQLSLFEFAFEKLVMHRLDPAFGFSRVDGDEAPSADNLTEHGGLLLSALAHVGRDETDEVEAAFAAGSAKIFAEPKLKLRPLDDCGLRAIDAALDCAAAAGPRQKKLFVEACALTIAHDGEIRPSEATLFRVICGTLDVPCPPLNCD